MKSSLEYPRKIPKKIPIPFKVIHSLPVRYPLVEQLLLLLALKPTPQRRRLNCFQRNTLTSWWPRSGPRSIKRSSKLCRIIKQARRPVRRATLVTMRTHRKPRQKTKATVKRTFQLLIFARTTVTKQKYLILLL